MTIALEQIIDRIDWDDFRFRDWMFHVVPTSTAYQSWYRHRYLAYKDSVSFPEAQMDWILDVIQSPYFIKEAELLSLPVAERKTYMMQRLVRSMKAHTPPHQLPNADDLHTEPFDLDTQNTQHGEPFTSAPLVDSSVSCSVLTQLNAAFQVLFHGAEFDDQTHALCFLASHSPADNDPVENELRMVKAKLLVLENVRHMLTSEVYRKLYLSVTGHYCNNNELAESSDADSYVRPEIFESLRLTFSE